MTTPLTIDFVETDLEAFAAFDGKIALLATADGKLDPAGRRINRMAKGAVERLVSDESWEKVKEGEGVTLNFPAGMAAKGLQVIKLDRRPDAATARKAGASIAKFKGKTPLLVAAGNNNRIAELSLGLALRTYAFEERTSAEIKPNEKATIHCTKPEEAAAAAAPMAALAEGTFFTRDLVNEPANILTTDDFAARLAAMQELGLEVEILEEDELEKLGMRTLLSVGQGSDSPSKVVVMQWKGGGDEKPLALVGKGVVFDTGGISLKPAGGMEDMIMDMGGAGVVSGVMRTLALRKAKANVVGLVGLVENMPSSNATRPGDVVVSMKGDTVEIINTDAEGRLVLADVLWYAQERFEPTGVVDLATLTGAIIIGLGHENAGVFSNNDAFCNAFLRAAGDTGEGAWRMPLGDAYDRQIKSDIADIKNVGGRPAGSITAAQFLQRFIKDDVPWIHLDIAGVAWTKGGTDMAPKRATGWGVAALDQLVRAGYEAE